ncbi:MAG: IMP cyclohydrolase [Clostridia bacterium]|nr:IMP cyclohydrolase [Clostridia bacterium]MBR2884775.1 IMP cyclohydrolase [Clostridia bacterium]
MNVYETKTIAERIKGNSYVGRGIIAGKTADGKKAVTAYFIMGRSENSRNRIFEETEDGIIIYPFDASKVEDPSLIIYSPIRKIDNKLIVTNGDQTDTIYNFIKQGKNFIQALNTRGFEPDAPNFTPRISCMLTFDKGDFSYDMNILKSADSEGSACARYNFSYPSLNGVGHFIHTYVCDGNPIPTFQGEPERISIPDDIDAFTNEIWENLDEQNKISIYVRYIDLESGECENRLINKNK